MFLITITEFEFEEFAAESDFLLNLTVTIRYWKQAISLCAVAIQKVKDDSKPFAIKWFNDRNEINLYLGVARPVVRWCVSPISIKLRYFDTWKRKRNWNCYPENKL